MRGEGGNSEWYEYRGPAGNTIRTLVRVWDDAKADDIYFMTELNAYANGEVIKNRQLWGDRDWAKKIAKRYDLSMPKSESEAR